MHRETRPLDNSSARSELPFNKLHCVRSHNICLTSLLVDIEVSCVGSGRASRHARGSRTVTSDEPLKNPPVQGRQSSHKETTLQKTLKDCECTRFWNPDLHLNAQASSLQLEWTSSLNSWGGAPHSQLPNPYVTGTCNANTSKYYDPVPLQ